MACAVVALLAVCGFGGAMAEQAAPDESLTAVAGRVVNEQGTPVEGILIEARYYEGTTEATTDADGEFRLLVPQSRLSGLFLIGIADDEESMASQTLPFSQTPEPPEDLTLELKPAMRIEVWVVDAEGEPIAEAGVGAVMNQQNLANGTTGGAGEAVLAVPSDAMLTDVYAMKPGAGLDYISFRSRTGGDRSRRIEGRPCTVTLSLTGSRSLRVVVTDAESGFPIAGARVSPTFLSKEQGGDPFYGCSSILNSLTNEAGEVTLDPLPTWNERTQLRIGVFQAGYEHFNADVRHDEEPVAVELDRLMPLRGRAGFADGRPAAGIQIKASGSGVVRDGSRVATSRNSAVTDDDGRYELLVPPYQGYVVAVQNPQWAAEPRSGFAVMPGPPVEDIDFVLRPATRLFGRATVGVDEQPIANLRMWMTLQGERTEVPFGVRGDANTFLVDPRLQFTQETNDGGEFEFFLGPGIYILRGPRQAKPVRFQIGDETEREININAPRPEQGRLTGEVVTGDPPGPVSQARIEGIYRHHRAGRDLSATTDDKGRFLVERGLYRTVLHARSEDGALAGVVEIGREDPQVTIALEPVATAVGRLVDTDGKPAEGAEIQYGVKVPIGDDDAPWREAFGGTITTDADGRFELKNLVLGQPYRVQVTMEREPDGSARSWRQLAAVQPESAETPIDLGDLTRPQPYKPPTLEERVAVAFQSSQTVEERYGRNRRDTQLGHMKLLVVLADPESELTREYFRLHYEDADVRGLLNDYRLLPLASTGEAAHDVREWVRRSRPPGSDVSLPEEGMLRLVVIPEDEGPWILLDRTADDSAEQWREDLLHFLRSHAPPPLNARELLAEALDRASRENKRVFVQETATWCGPCWRLSRFIDEHRETFEKDYIHLKLDHRWEHCREVVQELRPDEKRRGIPWSVILDSEGNVLITSDGPDGNIGFPGSPERTEYFLKMLSQTAIRLDEAALETLRSGLE